MGAASFIDSLPTDRSENMIGPMREPDWASDPKHLGFVLARYKFAAKMLAGRGSVIELGCGDGVASRIVSSVVPTWFGIELDNHRYEYAAKLHNGRVFQQDFLKLDAMPARTWDAAYCIDVWEHIPQEKESDLLKMVHGGLRDNGVFIVGTPSLESQLYASSESLRHHVNCKTQGQLREVMGSVFPSVFMFGMNDEVLHTGYPSMCHYNFALCIK